MSLELQRYGRNKSTIVNKTYINSGEYRNKFDKITDSKEVNRVIYSKSKEMLVHRSGTLLEDMYWIDGATGEVIASALNEQTEGAVVYSEMINKAIKGKSNLIAIHTHPHSMPPSIADFNSAFEHGYKTGIVLCHDGTVYGYRSSQYISPSIYLANIAKYIKAGFSEKEAQLQSLRKLSENYNIDLWEVI